MLIELSSTAEPTVEPAAAVRRPAEIAAHEARMSRVDRALDAIDDLARRRRTHELVQAVERLGAGLHHTMDALDDAIDAAVDAVQPVAWRPISAPLVPITAFVADPSPAPVAALAAPLAAPPPAVPAAPLPEAPAAVAHAVVPPAAPAPVVPVATSPVVPEAAPKKQRREAPAGLAAFVIPAPEA